MKRQILFILLLSLSGSVFSQNPIGMPDIINYDNSVYGGGTHNWDIQQDRNGVMYFANDEGLLSFDGTRWKIYPLANKTILRSIKIAPDGKLYAGGQGDFGYFAPDIKGILKFKSLRNEIPKQFHSFADIWNIEYLGDAIFFQAENNIFKWQNNRIQVYSTTSKWVYIGKSNQSILAQDEQRGLLRLYQNEWVPYLKTKLPQQFSIRSITSINKDSLVLNSWSHGIMLIHQGKTYPYLNQIVEGTINRTYQIDSNTLGIGTLNNGFYLVENNGKKLFHINKNAGLQSNSLLSIFKDSANNIWLGLADGISFIANNNAIKHINATIFDNAAGHTSILYKNEMYLGLSNGFYKLPSLNKNDLSLTHNLFSLVNNTAGQAWGANVINQKLLIGKHEGAFEVNNNKTKPLVEGKGFWNFVPYQQQSKQPLILAGNYNGIAILDKDLKSIGNVQNFNESARFLIVDDENNIWVSHPYKGIYRIVLENLRTKSVNLYTQKNGLPSTFNNHIYQINHKIVVSTERGIYTYDPERNKFIPSSYFKPIFKEKYIRYLKQDSAKNIWFIEEKKLGVAQYKNNSYKILYIPSLDGKALGGFEHINCIDKNNIIVGAQKGFYHINFEKYLANNNRQQVRISMVKAFGKSDRILFGGYFNDVNNDVKQHLVPEVKHRWNSFHFEFSSTINKSKPNTFYSCFLKGFDENWTTRDKKTEKDYTNLPAGTYVFMVKTLDNLGNESPVASYKFTILPPWYQTIYAYLVYIAAFIFLIYLIYKRQQIKIDKHRIAFQQEQEHIKYMHQLELDKSEKEIIKLKNEKLELEIESKNSDLASNTMHLLQKADLLSKIKGELFKLKKDEKNEQQSIEFNKLIRLLNAEEKYDDSWHQFSQHFDKVHVDFIKQLKEKFPNISNTELRLSAYLKMNLSTKEIATLMKISPRGVEIGRYRLRKKLEIPSNVNLFEYFNNL